MMQKDQIVKSSGVNPGSAERTLFLRLRGPYGTQGSNPGQLLARQMLSQLHSHIIPYFKISNEGTALNVQTQSEETNQAVPFKQST